MINEKIRGRELDDEPMVQFFDENGPIQSVEANDQTLQSFPDNMNVDYLLKTEQYNPKISQ